MATGAPGAEQQLASLCVILAAASGCLPTLLRESQMPSDIRALLCGVAERVLKARIMQSVR